jgi:hypothetical protein
MMVHACNSNYSGDEFEASWSKVAARLFQNQNTTTKKNGLETWLMFVEHMPHILKVLGLIPNTGKKRINSSFKDQRFIFGL